MKNQRKKKYTILAILMVVVIGVGIGFASLSTQLNIMATAAVNPEWKIEYVQDGQNPFMRQGVTILSEPVLYNTSINSLSVEFDAGGGELVYFYKVKNKGSIPAKIGTIENATPICSSITENGTGIGGTYDDDAQTVCDNIQISVEHEYSCGYNMGSYAGGEESGLPEAVINTDNQVKVDDELQPGEMDCRKLIIKYNGPAPANRVIIGNINISEIYEQLS